MKNTLQTKTVRRTVRRVPTVCRKLSDMVLRLTADQAWQLLAFASQLTGQAGHDDDPHVHDGVAYGIMGIAAIFGCSRSTAQRIKHSGVIDGALRQVGRTIVVDVDEALRLAGKDYEKQVKRSAKKSTEKPKAVLPEPQAQSLPERREVYVSAAQVARLGQAYSQTAKQKPLPAGFSSLSSFSSMNNNNYYNNNNREKEKKEEKEEKSGSRQRRLQRFDAHQAMDSLVPAAYRKAFGRWLDYKDEMGQPYRSATTMQVCVDRLVQLSGHDPVRALAVVDQSIIAGWRGLFPLHGGVSGGEVLRHDQIGVVLRNDSYEKFKDVKGW